MGTAPTFIDINKNYGYEVAQAWLTSAWAYISEQSGNKGKITDYQVRSMASITASEYGYLKISEFMLFARWFLAGKYNHIFGTNVDPLQLMVALRNFIAERNDLIARYEQAAREDMEKKERERNPPITWEQFCERNGMRKDNPLGAIFK